VTLEPLQEAPDNPLVEGLERLPVHPTTLVIFGATGDLSRRKLLPAIYNRGRAAGALQPDRQLAQRPPRRGVRPAGVRGDPPVQPP
jgi:hypothetical protein